MREIRKFAKREWDWEFKAAIAAEIRRRWQQAAAEVEAEEAAALTKAAAKVEAEKELIELIRSTPVDYADCPF